MTLAQNTASLPTVLGSFIMQSMLAGSKTRRAFRRKPILIRQRAGDSKIGGLNRFRIQRVGWEWLMSDEP